MEISDSIIPSIGRISSHCMRITIYIHTEMFNTHIFPQFGSSKPSIQFLVYPSLVNAQLGRLMTSIYGFSYRRSVYKEQIGNNSCYYEFRWFFNSTPNHCSPKFSNFLWNSFWLKTSISTMINFCTSYRSNFVGRNPCVHPLVGIMLSIQLVFSERAQPKILRVV